MKTPLISVLTVFALALAFGSPLRAEAPAEAADSLHGLPLKLHETFADGAEGWQLSDEDSWAVREVEGQPVLSITRRQSDFRPPHRSPFHVGLLKDVEVEDFVLTFRVRSTLDTGAHRDICVFFGYQDPANFYYVHIGARPDPNSGQIMLVQDAPRRNLTDNKEPIPWTDDWHEVKIVRNVGEGTIAVYFDDMENPWLTVEDKTFGKGLIGIGSFDDLADFTDIRLYAE